MSLSDSLIYYSSLLFLDLKGKSLTKNSEKKTDSEYRRESRSHELIDFQ